jgi:hypothetical protein
LQGAAPGALEYTPTTNAPIISKTERVPNR